MATSDARAKVAKLLDALVALEEEYQGKRQAIHAEMAAILGGGEGIGAKLGRLKRAYSELWQHRHGPGPYVFNHAVDTGHLKRFLRTHTEAQIEQGFVEYLRRDDAFYIRGKHPFLLFVKGFNEFAAARGPVVDQAATDTASKLQGLRGE